MHADNFLSEVVQCPNLCLQSGDVKAKTIYSSITVLQSPEHYKIDSKRPGCECTVKPRALCEFLDGKWVFVQQTWKHWPHPSWQGVGTFITHSIASVCRAAVWCLTLWAGFFLVGLVSWPSPSPLANFTEATKNTPQSSWAGLSCTNLTWLTVCTGVSDEANSGTAL